MSQQTPPSPASDAAIERLLCGVKHFQTHHYPLNAPATPGFARPGPQPKVLLVACSDARVDPAMLTGALPGELFVVQSVANLVPPYRLADGYDGARAAIEYAVRDLEVQHIVVLGHACCEGIQTLLNHLLDRPPQRDFMGPWGAMALDACFKYIVNPGGHPRPPNGAIEVDEVNIGTLRQHQHLAERAGVRGSLANLYSYPWIQSRIDDGLLRLHGWWFDLESGDLWRTNASNTLFLPILD